jgi:O-antigen/teichoic acid export membrane protein
VFLTIIKRLFNNGLLKETALYGLTGVISKFAPIIIIPIYIGAIGIEGFGVLDLYITIGLAIFIICEIQAVSGVMRSYYESKERNTLGELIGSAIKIYGVTYISLLGIFFLMFIVPTSLIDIRFDYLFPIVLAIFPRQIFSLCSIIFRMEHRAKIYVIINLSNVIITAILGVVFIYILEPSVLSVLYGMSLAQFIMATVSYLYILKMIKIKSSANYVKEIVYYGVPIAVSSLAGWLLASSGRLVIADQSTEFDLGVYSLSLKIAMIYMVLLQAFRTAWDPYCMKKFGENNSKLVFAKSLNVYWVFGSLVILLIYFISPFVISLLGAEAEALNKGLLLLILLGYLWQGAINIIAVGNAWARKTYINSIGTILGGAISLSIAYLLVHNLGVIAGGLGYLIGMIVSFLIIYNLAQRNVYIPYNNVISLVFFILSICGSLYVISTSGELISRGIK